MSLAMPVNASLNDSAIGIISRHLANSGIRSPTHPQSTVTRREAEYHYHLSEVDVSVFTLSSTRPLYSYGTHNRIIAQHPSLSTPLTMPCVAL